jgi:hypothetical protein
MNKKLVLGLMLSVCFYGHAAQGGKDIGSQFDILYATEEDKQGLQQTIAFAETQAQRENDLDKGVNPDDKEKSMRDAVVEIGKTVPQNLKFTFYHNFIEKAGLEANTPDKLMFLEIFKSSFGLDN